MLFILKSIVAGFVLAAPLGPVAFFCIRWGSQGRLKTALMGGLGAALADGVFASILIFGITPVVDFFEAYKGLFKIGGSLILILYGLVLIYSSPEPPKKEISPNHVFLGCFFLTLSNPLSLVGLSVLMAAFSLENRWDLPLWVTSGAMVWWTGLTLFSQRLLKGKPIQKGMGLFLVVLGIFLLLSGGLASTLNIFI